MLFEECRCSQLHADIETEDCLLMFHVSHTLWKLCSGDIWCWWCWSQLDQVNKKSYILQLIVVGSIWCGHTRVGLWRYNGHQNPWKIEIRKWQKFKDWTISCKWHKNPPSVSNSQWHHQRKSEHIKGLGMIRTTSGRLETGTMLQWNSKCLLPHPSIHGHMKWYDQHCHCYMYNL